MRYVLVSSSCAFAVLGVAAVLVHIPGVSDYAFWIVLASYMMLALNYIGVRSKPGSGDVLAVLSAVVAVVSVAAVFVYIPFISDYAFWLLVPAWAVLGFARFIVTSHLDSTVTVAAREFRDPAPITRILKVLLWTLLAVEAVAVVSGLLELSLLLQMQAGSLSRPVMTAAAQASDLRQRVIGWTQIILSIATVIIFAWWIYLLNDNKRRFGASGPLFTPGWALGSFFVPFANLWVPYQAMKELWQVSADPKRWQKQQRGKLLPWWWFLWIASNILGQLSFRLSLDAKTLPAFIAANVIADLANVVSVAGALAALGIVGAIAGMQHARIKEWAFVEALE